jgi:hypothetical protein
MLIIPEEEKGNQPLYPLHSMNWVQCQDKKVAILLEIVNFGFKPIIYLSLLHFFPWIQIVFLKLNIYLMENLDQNIIILIAGTK